MKKRLLALVVAVALSLGLTTVSGAPAEAAATPPILKQLAKRMKCKWGERDTLVGGGKSVGWHCVVRNKRFRTEYYLMKPKNFSRALDHWREWISDTSYDDTPPQPGYIARKGRILIVAQGGTYDSYSYEYAKYAARRTGGSVVEGYSYYN